MRPQSHKRATEAESSVGDLLTMCKWKDTDTAIPFILWPNQSNRRSAN